MSPTPDRRARLASRTGAVLRSPILLWGAFVLVHLWLGLLNLYAPGLPLGDVSIVYKFWTDQAIVANYWVGIDSSWVYPIVAILPMLAARAFGPGLYSGTWLSMIMLLDAVALAAIVGWGRGRRHLGIGWWWLGFLALLGPIALGRIDSVTVPLAIVGVTMIASRPRIATVVLAVATWIKVWPAAIIGAMIVSLRERARVAAVAVLVSAAIVAIVLAIGGGLNVFSFVTQQTGRGLQVEAPITTAWLWQAVAGVPNTFVYYDQSILTWQVRGPGVEVASALMTPLLALVLLAILVIAILAVRNGVAAADLLPTLSLAFVTACIAINKVGSPQYMTWLAAPVILGLATSATRRRISFRVPAILVLVLAGLTQVVYPYLYGWLLSLNVLMLVVLSARNVLLFVLLGWAVVVLWRLSRAPREDAVGEERGWLPVVWPLGLRESPEAARSDLDEPALREPT
ncbi:MAG TPA: hypothetical protein VGC18_14695 [Lacisediminihabitans sp.]|uniref:hypothetical protein n=1 Tax=Lacisediminihabitans sp. TaxID=2787631 RepID=UPI002EDBB683